MQARDCIIAAEAAPVMLRDLSLPIKNGHAVVTFAS
jgi:hypothetical protein